MDSKLTPNRIAPSSFTNLEFHHFSRLPTEIRLRIWSLASAPRRPRFIQVFYDAEKDSWASWEDSRGGLLPQVALVCREAFAEALSAYTKIFDTYFNFLVDTLFISDPMFTFRKPRKAFLRSMHAGKLQKVALTSDIYSGLEESHEAYPLLCAGITSILRELECLKTFTVVLSEDGAWRDEDREHSWDSDSGSDAEFKLDLDEDGESEEPVSVDEVFQSISESDGPERESEKLAETRRILNRREKDAMESMTKGYFRHVGNIYLDSAMSHADHWDSWASVKDELTDILDQGKEIHPEWTRPNVSIMVVRYGLQPFAASQDLIHIRGDYGDGVIEEESLKYKKWMETWGNDQA